MRTTQNYCSSGDHWSQSWARWTTQWLMTLTWRQQKLGSSSCQDSKRRGRSGRWRQRLQRWGWDRTDRTASNRVRDDGSWRRSQVFRTLYASETSQAARARPGHWLQTVHSLQSYDESQRRMVVIPNNLFYSIDANCKPFSSGAVRPVKLGQLPRVSNPLPRVWLADN